MIANFSSAVRRRGPTDAAVFLNQFHSPSTSPASSTLDLRCEPRSDSEFAMTDSKSCSPISAPTPEILPEDDVSKRERSGSWSSVKEDRNDGQQTFLVTVKRKYEDITDQPTYGATFRKANACCGCHHQCVSDRLRPRSRSMSSVRKPRSRAFDEDVDTESVRSLSTSDSISQTPLIDTPQLSMLEKLPVEVLESIVGQLALDQPPNEYTPRNRDLISLLHTSKKLHHVTLRALYHHVSFQHSYSFSKFLAHITAHPGLGDLVRRLDLSHFSSLGMGRSAELNSEIQNLTATTLLRCLELTPNAEEVLMQEHLDGDVDQAVLKKVFYALPRVQALDLCGSSTEFFVSAFAQSLANLRRVPDLQLRIQNLSLHECFTIPNVELELLLSRLPDLRILDLHHTRINDQALAAISDSARLTHLNLGRCTGLTGAAVVDFLTSHPAASAGTLLYLNLSSDPSRHRLLQPWHVHELLSKLPSSLRSLNITGAPITVSELGLLRPLTRQLEELSIGYADLAMPEIVSLLGSVPSSGSSSPISDALTDASRFTPHTLHYLDLTGIKSVTSSTLFANTSALLSQAALPLEVIELSDPVISSLRQRSGGSKKQAWCVRECGRRGWYVRRGVQDDGRRSWKMGGKAWGMRKVPVAWGEVGGLYGHYMFKK